MSMGGWTATMAVAAMMLPGVASAQGDDPAIRHAARCLIVVASLTANQDATLKMSGLMGSFFFAGQIFGAQPDIDLTRLMTREATAMDESQTKALLVQCGEELKQRGGQVTAAGQALSALAAKAR
jgi:hypothetical protein